MGVSHFIEGHFVFTTIILEGAVMRNKTKRRMATKEDLDKSILVDGELPKEARRVYEASFAASQEAVEPLIDEIRAARRLGKDDFTIRMNARG